jgi:hypothetical protein
MPETNAPTAVQVQFTLSTFKAGSGQNHTTSINGAAGDSNGYASFHMMKLVVLNIPNDVGFEIAVVAQEGNVIKEFPYVGNNKWSPSFEGHEGDIVGIRAFKVRLTGPQKNKYSVGYSANVVETHVSSPNKHDQVGNFSAKDGDWAGYMGSKPGFYAWVNSLTVSVA